MDSVVSSPLSPYQDDYSPQRTCGKFVPKDDNEPASPRPRSTKGRRQQFEENRKAWLEMARKNPAAGRDEAAPASLSTPCAKPKGPQVKSSATMKVEDICSRVSERHELADEIARLEPRKQIDRLLQEDDMLRLQIDMQGKAMTGFIQKSGWDRKELDAHLVDIAGQIQGFNQRTLPDKKELDTHLVNIEGRIRRQCAANQEDATVSMPAMARSVYNMDQDVDAVEKHVEMMTDFGSKIAACMRNIQDDEHEKFVKNLKERVGFDEMKARLEIIENGVREMGKGIEMMTGMLGVDEEEKGVCEGFAGEKRDSISEAGLCGKRKGAVSPGHASPSKRNRRPTWKKRGIF